MEKLIKTILSPAARTTAIYYVGNFLLNIGRYFFHLILLRLLTPPEYGEFLSYLSLTYLLGIPMGTIGSVVVKYVSEFKGRGEDKSVNHFYYFLLKKAGPITFGLGFLLVIFSSQLASIFKAHSIAFIVLGVSMLVSLFQTIIGSYLIALQRFILQTIFGYLSVFLTIIFSIIFIKLNFGATGAVLGQLAAGVVVSLFTYLSIKKTVTPKLKGQEKFSISLGAFTGYSIVFSLGISSLISTDVLLVRYLFDPVSSGIYSSLSILGRMIYFGLSPLSALALPIAAHRYASQGTARSVFIKLGSVLLLFGLVGAGIFTVFPEQIIKILSGSQYLSAAPLLQYFAFSMVFFALNQFIISYLMATGRPQANIFLLVATILQPILYFVFRNSLTSVILSNLMIHLGLAVTLIIYILVIKSTNPASVKSKI